MAWIFPGAVFSLQIQTKNFGEEMLTIVPVVFYAMEIVKLSCNLFSIPVRVENGSREVVNIAESPQSGDVRTAREL